MTDHNIGVDISKSHLDVFRLEDGMAQRVDNSAAGVRALTRWLGPDGWENPGGAGGVRADGGVSQSLRITKPPYHKAFVSQSRRITKPPYHKALEVAPGEKLPVVKSLPQRRRG